MIRNSRFLYYTHIRREKQQFDKMLSFSVQNELGIGPVRAVLPDEKKAGTRHDAEIPADAAVVEFAGNLRAEVNLPVVEEFYALPAGQFIRKIHEEAVQRDKLRDSGQPRDPERVDLTDQLFLIRFQRRFPARLNR